MQTAVISALTEILVIVNIDEFNASTYVLQGLGKTVWDE